MGRQPDEINSLPDGRTEYVHYRARRGPHGERARTRRIVGMDGRTEEVWHEVVNVTGAIVHQHQIPVKRKGDGQ